MIYKNKLIVLSFVLTFMVFYGCKQDETQSLVRANFSVQYPVFFDLDESGEANTIFALKTKKEQNSASSFIENVNLIEDKTNYKSYEQYFNNAEKQIENIAKIIEKKRFVVDGDNCLRLVFQISQESANYTFIQQFYAHKQKYYILTFSSDSVEFDDYSKSIEKVFNSFKLK
ncbi:PsbP-related protein [Flavobacteriaceae bacterium S356]|uniref:PsbP-related protein n=1 Tax=Asprobacillus argus TaxID=3076534 RepID=A0ABU3LHQ3_9FLAO|nr:PsbP-related protein [Flavobacteriaceae bacterium S356]